MGDHQKRAWEWSESLRPGVAPPAFIGPWFRGGGKSTTFELILARQAVLGRRRFFLYVSGTQDAANRHLQSVADTMEKVGVSRAMNQYNASKGWTANMLRTANGFNILAVGAETAVRGVKLDQFRPDGMIFDDIDSEHDSLQTIEKKTQTLTRAILPAGSVDVATVFIQNLIHQHSIMSRTLDGTLNILLDREQAPIVPAMIGLQWEEGKHPDGSGRKYFHITGGTATWEGFPVEACEREMNKQGPVPFLREYQHDVTVGGRFFADWDEKLHVVWLDDVSVEKHFTFWGGYDWGYGNPACFLLACIDERGAVLIIDEVYRANQTDPEQAAAVAECLKKWGLAKSEVTVLADPSMWGMKTDTIGRKIPNIRAFHEAGLRFIKANNDRTRDVRFGWANVRRYLHDQLPPTGDGKHTPFLRIVKNNCPNLVRTLPQMVHDPLDVEDLDTKAEDHAVDTLRYLLGAKPRPAKDDPAKAPKPTEPDNRPLWLKQKAKTETI